MVLWDLMGYSIVSMRLLWDVDGNLTDFSKILLSSGEGREREKERLGYELEFP